MPETTNSQKKVGESKLNVFFDHFFYLLRLTEVMKGTSTTTGANQQEMKTNTNLSFVQF